MDKTKFYYANKTIQYSEERWRQIEKPNLRLQYNENLVEYDKGDLLFISSIVKI